MVFSSTVFLFLFLPVMLIAYFNPLAKSRGYKNIVLLIGSLLFYAWGEPVFVLIMMASIVLNWKIALFMDKAEGKARRNYLVVAVVYDLGLLFVFKYLTFVTKNLGMLFNNNDIIVDIALPIGISFFVFEMLSYMFDVYYGNARVQKSLINVALYISMFPQLIAGPIVRYDVVCEDIDNRKENVEDFQNGIKRFIYGLGKKVILSNNLAIVADKAFELCANNELSTAMAYVGIFCYMLQIYFDFSGYSDMAIGLGKVFGFTFNENFDYPYISRSIPEFWRRWHISLSSWFRDYVMYPVMRTQWMDKIRTATKNHFGKNASKLIPTVIGTAIVWLFTGIWHGANWTFIMWGVYHGVLIITSMVFKKQIKAFEDKIHLGTNKLSVVIRVIKTDILVCIGYVFFKAASLTQAGDYFRALLGMGNNTARNIEYALFYLNNFKWIILIGAVVSLPVIPALKNSKFNKTAFAVIEGIILVIVLLISTSYLVRNTYNPFVYFNF